MAERTASPTRKVVAGGITGAVAFLVVSFLNRRGWDITAEEALSFNTVLVGIVQYMTPNKTVTQVGEKPNQQEKTDEDDS